MRRVRKRSLLLVRRPVSTSFSDLRRRLTLIVALPRRETAVPPPRPVFGAGVGSGSGGAAAEGLPSAAAVAARSAARASALAEVDVLAGAARRLVDLLLPPL
jgi:hypothetical protein